MAELFGAIQRGLGFILSAVYEVVPSYGLAIIVLTVVTRALLIPLTVKQTRSTQKMQVLQPELKKIQQKYKDLQKKAKDRQELQQLRLKMNEETTALFRQHGVSPFGSCLPLLAQMPVFFALFSIMRASLVAVPATAALIGGATIPADHFTAEQLKPGATICRPQLAGATAGRFDITCHVRGADGKVEQQRFQLGGLSEVDRNRQVVQENLDPSLIANCGPLVDGQQTIFNCRSAQGTGHLPRDGDLFADVNADRARVVGMHPGCTPRQVGDDFGVLQCTKTESDGSPAKAIPYYLLVVLIAATQYYSGRQMMARSKGGQMAQQQQMMTRVMPLLFGFISLGFPAGLNFYYLIFNVWQIGQQTLIFRHMDREEARGGPALKPPKRGLLDRARARMEQQIADQSARAADDTGPDDDDEDLSGPDDQTKGGQNRPHPRSKKKRKRKHR